MPRKNGADMLTFQEMLKTSTPIGAAVKRFAQTPSEDAAMTASSTCAIRRVQKLTGTHLRDAVDWLFCEWYISNWIDARKPHMGGPIEDRRRNLTPDESQFLQSDL
jgi:hypothetical protein